MIEFCPLSPAVLTRFDRCAELLSDYLVKNHKVFDLNIGLYWLDNVVSFSEKVTSAYRRTIYLLAENKEGKLTKWKVYYKKKITYPKEELFLSILKKYESYLTNHSYSAKTIKSKLRYARFILLYFENQGFCSMEEVTHQIVSDYFATDHFSNRKPAGVGYEANQVKLFLQYLEDENITMGKKLDCAVPRYRVQQEKIITTISDFGKEQILSDYPHLLTNKRFKAMSLLALHLGFRSIDIRNLKFNDINWEASIINVSQQKTGVTIKSKIDVETQNALIDYILNERRKCNCDNVFVTAVGPVKKLDSNSTSTWLRNNCDDIKKHVPRQGLHIMRRTFASKLLNVGTELPVISTALGHKDKKQIQHYLSVDEKRMKECALDLTVIPYKGRLF